MVIGAIDNKFAPIKVKGASDHPAVTKIGFTTFILLFFNF